MKISISQISNEEDSENNQNSFAAKKGKKEIKLIRSLDTKSKEPKILDIKLKNIAEPERKTEIKVETKKEDSVFKVSVKNKKGKEEPKEVVIKKIVKPVQKEEKKEESKDELIEEKPEKDIKDEIVLIGQDKPVEKEEKKETPKNAKHGLILIAEDEKPLSRALEIKLTKEGHKIIVAYNGEEAIKYLDKNDFDMIILDLVMPKKDGFAVLEHLNRKNKKSNIIVLSNLAQEEDFKKARDLGAMTYFIKSNTPIIELVQYIKENI